MASSSSIFIAPLSLPLRSVTRSPKSTNRPSIGLLRRASRAPLPPIRADVAGSINVAGAGAGEEDGDPIKRFLNRDYKWGFAADIDTFALPKGLSESTIRDISAHKGEPEWMLDYRLSSLRSFLSMPEPRWSDVRFPPIDLQSICFYSEPRRKPLLGSLEEADPEVLETFDRLGIPLSEQRRLANVAGHSFGAVDAVFDSTSFATIRPKALDDAGVIFCSISEAIREHPDLVKKYLGTIVPPKDNYYAALNSAVFSDGSFCYIPKNTKCPVEISTYFRINDRESGQFERTLIVADEGSYVSYLEGCTAPSFDRNQLHAAVVELHSAAGAEIKYSTVQNWYPGDKDGNGGIYNFVTKRGLCSGTGSRISWTQVETGSAITWKYPSVVLKGDGSIGEFYSVALTKDRQQADTGTKMIHIGKNTRSRIVSKGISAGHSMNCYRGLVQVMQNSENAQNFSQCDSMLLGDKACANTYPSIQVKNPMARVQHEASTSKVGDEQLFYMQQRGIENEKAIAAMIGGFCSEVFKELPLEFASEVNALMNLKLEGSVG